MSFNSSDKPLQLKTFSIQCVLDRPYMEGGKINLVNLSSFYVKIQHHLKVI
jgi:hypothetical protein